MRAGACCACMQGIFIIRYHGFYALHAHGAYSWLLSQSDRRLSSYNLGR